MNRRKDRLPEGGSLVVVLLVAVLVYVGLFAWGFGVPVGA